MYTNNSMGATDASIEDNGFFGIGPNADYAYNNRTPGVWASFAVPEPSIWVAMLIGFFGLGAMMRRARNQRMAAAI